MQVDAVGESERTESAGASAVAHAKLKHFAHLALRFRDGLRLDVERTGIGQLVQVVPDSGIKVAKSLELPFLSGKPCQHTAFDI